MQAKQMLFGLLALIMASLANAQPFTYQGFLRVSGTPANGVYDFEFRLFDAASGGSQVGSTVSVNDLTVQNGLFTVELNFGSVWSGADRYLEIWVRPGSNTGGYQQLLPRVKITRTPYAARADAAPPVGAAGGDLSGSYPNPTVARLQGRAVSSTAPTSGQVLKWDGSAWSPSDDLHDAFWQASGSNIFYSAGNVGIGVSSPAYRLHVETNAGDRAIYGYHAATSGTTYGVWGRVSSPSGYAVYGDADTTSGTSYGGYFRSRSPAGVGVYGLHQATTGTMAGVQGVTHSTSDYAVGVQGEVSSTSPGGYSAAVRGINRGTGALGIGVWGSHEGSGWGVYGTSVSGTGVYGLATATSGTTYGMYGRSDSASGIGVYGLATATSGTTYGMYGRSASTSGTGVYGLATATSGTTYGMYGRSASTSGTGVYGLATATSGFTYGGWFESASTDGAGVRGYASAASGETYGGWFESASTSGKGVYGRATATSGQGWGVWGSSGSPHSSAYGVFGNVVAGGSGHAVYASGSFAATGTKSFQIDHPLRPETHYLNHFCAEGPEPYNLYRGTVVLDVQGEAWVQLPDYFNEINRDPTYHLTPVGAPMPNLHVAVEVRGNRFKIAGGAPGKKVSWEVKAVRNDLWVQRYGFQTEQEKEDDIKGKYLHPELHGQPKERGIHYHPEPERPQEVEKPK